MFPEAKPDLNNPPVILAVGGLDPSGGAGLHADIKTITALGGHACSLVTLLTVQDSHRVYESHPMAVDVLESQLQKLVTDIPPLAVKAGALGNTDTVRWLANGFKRLQGQSFRVVDPVLKAGGGGSLSSSDMLSALRSELLAHTDLLTPNVLELFEITGEYNEASAIAMLFHLGVKHVLVTGGHDDTPNLIHNRLYTDDGQYQQWQIPRLAGEFHGTGCSLASAITTLAARGLPLPQAIEQAQDWITRCLKSAYKPGRGQWFLNSGTI